MSEAVGRPPREAAPPPEDAGDQARSALLELPSVRVTHHWSDQKLVSASLSAADGSLVATVDRVTPRKPEARFAWVLGDVKLARYYIRTPEGALLWQLVRKPHFGGVKADMSPVPDQSVVRAVRGMPWTRNDFHLVAKGGLRLATVRWAGGMFAIGRTVVDSAGVPFLETFEHGEGPWADYSVRRIAIAAEPQRTAGFVAAVTLHTALTKTRN